MMNELAQLGTFSSGSAGGKGASRSQAAPGSRAGEFSRKRSFPEVFRNTCQARQRNSAGRTRSHGTEEEDASKQRLSRNEGDFNGDIDSARLFLIGAQSGEPAAEEQTGPQSAAWHLAPTEIVAGDRQEDGKHAPADTAKTGPLTAEVFTGIQSLADIATEVEGETPAEAGEPGLVFPAGRQSGMVFSQTDPSEATTSPLADSAPAERENAHLTAFEPVTTGEDTEVARARAPASIMTGETAKESAEAAGTGTGLRSLYADAEPGKAENPAGLPVPEVATYELPVDAEGGSASGRSGQEEPENYPHPAVGGKANPAFFEEQYKPVSEEQTKAFPVPGKIKTTDPNKAEQELFASPRLQAEQVTADPLPVEENSGVNYGHEGERISEAEKLMSQIVQGARMMVKDGVAQMRLELQPPELGKLHLALVVERDVVTARFTAESQAVQALIESNLPELRSTLQEAGLQVDQLQVEVQTDAGSQSDSFEQLFSDNSPAEPGRPEITPAFFSEADNEEGVREEAAWLGRVNFRV